MIFLVALLFFLVPLVIEFVKTNFISYDDIKSWGLLIFGIACLVFMQEKSDLLNLIFFIIYIVIFIVVYIKENSDQKELDSELKKEKENYEILSKKYYEFCKTKFIKAQKEIHSLNVKHSLGVDNYNNFVDEVDSIKKEFYDCIKQERDRHVFGQVANVLDFNYRSSEHSKYTAHIEQICHEFFDLLYNA